MKGEMILKAWEINLEEIKKMDREVKEACQIDLQKINELLVKPSYNSGNHEDSRETTTGA
jgi:hypothetical protein